MFWDESFLTWQAFDVDRPAGGRAGGPGGRPSSGAGAGCSPRTRFSRWPPAPDGQSDDCRPALSRWSTPEFTTTAGATRAPSRRAPERSHVGPSVNRVPTVHGTTTVAGAKAAHDEPERVDVLDGLEALTDERAVDGGAEDVPVAAGLRVDELVAAPFEGEPSAVVGRDEDASRAHVAPVGDP